MKNEKLWEVVRHVAENVEGTHILWATCTAPLVFPKYIEAQSMNIFLHLKRDMIL